MRYRTENHFYEGQISLDFGGELSSNVQSSLYGLDGSGNGPYFNERFLLLISTMLLCPSFYS